MMACLGGHMQFGLLQTAADRSPEQVEHDLLAPLEDGLVVVDDGGHNLNAESVLRFRHDRVQEVAYDRIGPERRTELHAALGAATRRRPGVRRRGVKPVPRGARRGAAPDRAAKRRRDVPRRRREGASRQQLRHLAGLPRRGDTAAAADRHGSRRPDARAARDRLARRALQPRAPQRGRRRLPLDPAPLPRPAPARRGDLQPGEQPLQPGPAARRARPRPGDAPPPRARHARRHGHRRVRAHGRLHPLVRRGGPGSRPAPAAAGRPLPARGGQARVPAARAGLLLRRGDARLAGDAEPTAVGRAGSVRVARRQLELDRLLHHRTPPGLPHRLARLPPHPGDRRGAGLRARDLLGPLHLRAVHLALAGAARGEHGPRPAGARGPPAGRRAAVRDVQLPLVARCAPRLLPHARHLRRRGRPGPRRGRPHRPRPVHRVLPLLPPGDPRARRCHPLARRLQRRHLRRAHAPRLARDPPDGLRDPPGPPRPRRGALRRRGGLGAPRRRGAEDAPLHPGLLRGRAGLHVAGPRAGRARPNGRPRRARRCSGSSTSAGGGSPVGPATPPGTSSTCSSSSTPSGPGRSGTTGRPPASSTRRSARSRRGRGRGTGR